MEKENKHMENLVPSRTHRFFTIILFCRNNTNDNTAWKIVKILKVGHLKYQNVCYNGKFSFYNAVFRPKNVDGMSKK